jgi:hypothetical protein
MNTAKPTVFLVQRRTGARALAVVLGLFIAGAAILKAQQLFVGGPSPSGSNGHRLALLVLVHLELALALWLFSGVTPQWSHVAAIGCFFCFFLVASYQALAGKAVCGCFGRFSVTPALTAGIDAVAVAALLIYRPAIAPVVAARLRNISLAILLAGLAGSFPFWAARVLSPTPLALVVAPARLEAGTLRPGETATLSFMLRNDGEHAVRVDTLSTTCNCLQVELAARAIEPMSAISGMVIVDTSQEGDFRGDLEMGLTGQNAEGGVLFQLAVGATVR